jgi:hypothetical protein
VLARVCPQIIEFSAVVGMVDHEFVAPGTHHGGPGGGIAVEGHMASRYSL